MINRQIALELDDALPGMTLQEPVLDGSGMPLLPAGTVLTESIITSLRRRGIDTLIILNEAVSEAELKRERERVEKRLQILFRKVVPGGTSNALASIVLAYKLGEWQ